MSSTRFDKQNQLSAAQAFTGSATQSTNAYQKQTAAQDLSIGRRVSILIMPTVAAGAGSTWTFDFIQDDDGAGTNLTVLNTITVLAASLIPGAAFELPCPSGVMTQKCLSLRATGTGGTTTVTLDSYLIPSDEFPAFKSFVNVVPVSV